MSWQEVSLAGVSESVTYGYTASASEDQVGPKFLRITDIVPESLDWNSVPYCKASERDQNRFSLEVGDIVVARTGATVGYAKQIRDVESAVFASYMVRFMGGLWTSRSFLRWMSRRIDDLQEIRQISGRWSCPAECEREGFGPLCVQVTPAVDPKSYSFNPLSLRRPDREQPAADCVVGGGGAVALPRVVCTIPLPRPRTRRR